MPLTPYLGSFDPEDIAVLMSAFDEAWQQIQQRSVASESESDAKDRLARIIVNHANTGRFDKEMLVQHVLIAYERRLADQD